MNSAIKFKVSSRQKNAEMKCLRELYELNLSYAFVPDSKKINISSTLSSSASQIMGNFSNEILEIFQKLFFMCESFSELFFSMT